MLKNILVHNKFKIYNLIFTIYNSKDTRLNIDQETGLYYYGARYYSPTLSIWASVDPLSDKYPSMSAYMYCAGNPVILVDPDGREVWLTGEQVAATFKSLQQGTNLILSIDSKGKITATGDALNKNDQQLLDAINSTDVSVKIQTGYGATNGHYNGTTYNSENNTAESTNLVNIYGLQQSERKGAEGSGIMHEVTEGFEMGLISIENKSNINRAAYSLENQTIGAGKNQSTISKEIYENKADYDLYLIGHGRATNAPNEMTRKQAKNFKTPQKEYTNPIISRQIEKDRSRFKGL